MPSTKKFTPEIDAKLYKEFVAVAKRNGQSQRRVLEEALKFYLKNVVPSQHLVMDAFEQSVASNRRQVAFSWTVNGMPSGAKDRVIYCCGRRGYLRILE